MKIKPVVFFILSCLLILAGCIMPAAAPAESNVSTGQATVGLLPNEPPPFATTGWQTDFTKRSIDWDAILRAAPRRIASRQLMNQPLKQ